VRVSYIPLFLFREWAVFVRTDPAYLAVFIFERRHAYSTRADRRSLVVLAQTDVSFLHEFLAIVANILHRFAVRIVEPCIPRFEAGIAEIRLTSFFHCPVFRLPFPIVPDLGPRLDKPALVRQ